VNDVEKISRPNGIDEIVVFTQGVNHGAMRPSILVRVIVEECNEFIKDVGKMLGFVVNHDVPCHGVMFKCRKELIKLLGGPARVWQCGAQASCVFNSFTFPVKRVFFSPFFINGHAFSDAKVGDSEDVFGIKGGKDIIVIERYVYEIDASSGVTDVIISHTIRLQSQMV